MQDSYLFTVLKSGLGTLYSDIGFNVFKLLMKFMELLMQKDIFTTRSLKQCNIYLYNKVTAFPYVRYISCVTIHMVIIVKQ